jgi:hypothetical protein
MGDGSFIYRRPSGIYVFRLSVPESHRKWFSGAAIHPSTHRHERMLATGLAQQLRVTWAAIRAETRANIRRTSAYVCPSCTGLLIDRFQQ